MKLYAYVACSFSQFLFFSVTDEVCEYHNFFPTKREIIFDEAVDAQLLGEILFCSLCGLYVLDKILFHSCTSITYTVQVNCVFPNNRNTRTSGVNVKYS